MKFRQDQAKGERMKLVEIQIPQPGEEDEVVNVCQAIQEIRMEERKIGGMAWA